MQARSVILQFQHLLKCGVTVKIHFLGNDSENQRPCVSRRGEL